MGTMATEHGNDRAVLRLLAWMSPAFPVGGFAYSAGLEAAVDHRLITDAESLGSWLETGLICGALFNDAILLTQSWHHAGDADAIAGIADLGRALAGSAERYLELIQQGEAFSQAASAWPHAWLSHIPAQAPYPVAIGVVAASSAIPLHSVLEAFLHTVVSQGVSAAIRLGVIGQRQGVAQLAALEGRIVEAAARAAATSLDDLGSATVMADVMALRHEVQTTRLFRS